MTSITHGDVRESIAVARSHGEKFFEQIAWQVENQTWLILGYKSWDEMREAEYADMRGLMAPSAERPELAARLRRSGLTQQSIAHTLGVTDRTVRNDLNRKDFRFDAPIQTERGERPPSYAKPERIDRETGEIVTGPHVEPLAPSGKSLGLDGKTYTRPAPSAPKRRPLADQAHDAAANLTAALERVERIFADDRFTQNREQVGEVTRAHLLRTAQVCQHLAEQLPS